MPNHKLSPNIIDHMQSVGKALCARRVAYMETGFPIGRDKMQAAILPAKWRDVIMEMKRDGVSALNSTASIIVEIKGEGITRTTHAQIHRRTEGFLYANVKPQADLSVLTPEEITKLATWVNTAVQERRLANLANRTINNFFDDGQGKSVAHVVARWPALITLIDPDLSRGYLSYHEQKVILPGWKQKFSNPPNNLKPYAWAPNDPWLAKHRKAMLLTETVLASAQMLPKEIPDTAEVTANVRSWTPLPGDLDKP